MLQKIANGGGAWGGGGGWVLGRVFLDGRERGEFLCDDFVGVCECGGV